MGVASQTNWLCPRCSTDLFGHVDLVTPSDQDLIDLAINLFSPSPVKKPNASETPSPPLNDENKRPPSSSHSIISVSSTDSPWKDGSTLFLAPGPYLTIQGLAEARRVGEAVFFITFPRQTSYKGQMGIGLVRDCVMGQLRISRLFPHDGQEPSLEGVFALRLEKDVEPAKTLLNLANLSMVSPSFPIYQVRRLGWSVEYRLSPRMIEWFVMYGGEYRGLGSHVEGFEGVYRKWRCAHESQQGKVELARVMQALTFLRANPFKTYERTF